MNIRLLSGESFAGCGGIGSDMGGKLLDGKIFLCVILHASRDLADKRKGGAKGW
jgi:hypothetical protein